MGLDTETFLTFCDFTVMISCGVVERGARGVRAVGDTMMAVIGDCGGGVGGCGGHGGCSRRRVVRGRLRVAVAPFLFGSCRHRRCECVA